MMWSPYYGTDKKVPGTNLSLVENGGGAVLPAALR